MTIASRILIVYDGHFWFIRYVRAIEHDMDRDEQVYRCDAPMGGSHATLDDAIATLRAKHVVD